MYDTLVDYYCCSINLLDVTFLDDVNYLLLWVGSWVQTIYEMVWPPLMNLRIANRSLSRTSTSRKQALEN